MKKEQIKKRIEELQAEKNILFEQYGNKSFKTKEEFEIYSSENKSELLRLNQITQEVESLKWQLMSEQEKKEYQEYAKIIKEKYSED